jgi:hypothetical protein
MVPCPPCWPIGQPAGMSTHHANGSAHWLDAEGASRSTLGRAARSERALAARHAVARRVVAPSRDEAQPSHPALPVDGGKMNLRWHLAMWWGCTRIWEAALESPESGQPWSWVDRLRRKLVRRDSTRKS